VLALDAVLKSSEEFEGPVVVPPKKIRVSAAAKSLLAKAKPSPLAAIKQGAPASTPIAVSDATSTWKGIIGKGFSPDDFDQYVGSITLTTWKPQFVVLHNTAVPKLSQWHSVSGEKRMRGLESYYRDTMHWHAGPHLFVADDLIWVFTPLTVSGTHSPSWNRVSWGVEMVGDYNVEVFGVKVKNNAVRALAALHAKASLDPTTLHFHKEDPKTTHKGCPGAHVKKPDMIAALQDAMKPKSK
jgi:hypothetical protein